MKYERTARLLTLANLTTTLASLLLLLAMALLMSGCAQEDAPQPIYITVEAPEPEPPAEPEPVPVVAEPAVEDVEDAHSPAEKQLIALFRDNFSDALLFWSLDRQEQGNDSYIQAVLHTVTLKVEHGWTDEAIAELSIDTSHELLRAYKDDPEAIERINRYIIMLLDELGALDELGVELEED